MRIRQTVFLLGRDIEGSCLFARFAMSKFNSIKAANGVFFCDKGRSVTLCRASRNTEWWG